MKYVLFRKKMIIIAGIIMLFGALIPNYRSQAATEQEALQWVKSKVGQSIDADGTAGVQCVDLILAYNADMEKDNSNDLEGDDMTKGYLPQNLAIDSNLLLSCEYGYDSAKSYRICVEKLRSDMSGEYDLVGSLGGVGLPFDCYTQIPEAFSESGDYRVYVIVSDNSGAEETSEYCKFTWEKPSQSLGIPQNPHWDTEYYGVGTCNKVENVYAYYYTLFVDGEKAGGGWTYLSGNEDNPAHDFSSFIESYGSEHIYTFKVKALAQSPQDYMHSDWSVISDTLGNIKENDTTNTTEEPTTEQPETAEEQENKVTAPAKVKKLKLKNSKGRKAVIQWQKVSSAAGYQVQYSTNKAFKKAKGVYVKGNKYTAKKLKKNKTYYVRVRAYEVQAGNKVYGKWSKQGKVRIKK